MNTLKIVNVVGCRSSFIRMAPLLAEMTAHGGIVPVLVHTGHASDLATLGSFFRDTRMPEPHIFLNVGSGSLAHQTALVVQHFEGILFDLKPDLVLVVGDVNSTMACTMTAVKLGFPVGHVDAGLRSFDREMPEEINRVVTDAVSDLLFTSERSAVRNLQCEGIPHRKIFDVGNLLIDTLLMYSGAIARSEVLRDLGLGPRTYGVVSLRTDASAASPRVMSKIAAALERVQVQVDLVFPASPAAMWQQRDSPAWQRIQQLPNVRVVEPLAYVDFLKLLRESLFVLTDSPRVEEESTALGLPCLTLRKTTERPASIAQGTNRLVGTTVEKIVAETASLANGSIVASRLPEKWDGAAARRIVGVLVRQERAIKQLYKRVRARSLCPDISSAA